MAKFLKKVKNYNFSEELFSKGERIIIGISGGPDSVALAKVFHSLKKNYQLNLLLVHINYGLRGKDSEKDETFVKALAKKLGLPIRVYKYKGKKVSEESLRDFRYGVFEKVRQELSYDKVAVAHNKDDQVETILFNLFRGSGLRGLAGMRPKRDRIIRPFLAFERKEILQFLKEQRQAYRVDKSNREIIYKRNRIRNRLILFLEKNLNPKVKEAVFNVGENLRFDWQVVEQTVSKAYNNYIKKQGDKVVFEIEDLRGFSAGLRRQIFRKVIQENVGIKEVSLQNFKEFEKMLRSEKSKDGILKIKDVVIIKKGKKLQFSKTQ